MLAEQKVVQTDNSVWPIEVGYLYDPHFGDSSLVHI